jgi:outer membrane beta-barrel protein
MKTTKKVQTLLGSSSPWARVRAPYLLLATAIGLGAVTYSAPAEAQEIQLTGPLAGAPAVKKLRRYREGRFQLAPEASFTLLDEYRRAIMPGVHANYNITDWLAIAGYFDYGVVNSTTDLTDQIDATAPRNARTATNVNHDASGNPKPFTDQVAKMQWVGAAEAQFIPFRGKLAIFQKLFVDTDLYLHGGVAFVGLQERGDCGGSAPKQCADPSTFALQSRTALAPTFGIGLSFYTNSLVSLGVEYRAVPFSWNRAGFDQRGGGPNAKFPDNQINADDRTFKFNQMMTILIGFSFPTAPKTSE